MANKKKKVEVNEFDETIAASKSFYEKNKKAILYGGGSVLAIIIAVLLIHQFYITPRNQKASSALAKAEQLFMDGRYETALNGDSIDNIGFLDVIDQYGSTKAGNLAHMYAGICYAQQGKYEDAIKELKSFNDCGDTMISPAAVGALGNCYAEIGDLKKATDYLLKAAAKADNNTLSPIFLLQAGQLFENQNQVKEALDCYEQIRQKYQNSPQGMEVNKYIERLK